MTKRNVDLDKLCRICACESESNSVFSEENTNIHIQSKMKKYLNITVTSEDVLPTVICTICRKKLENIHRFATMALKSQEKLTSFLEDTENPCQNDEMENVKKEHSILHSILTKGQVSEAESEVTEVEVRVDPMLFLCALEDGSTTDNDDTNSIGQDNSSTNTTTENEPMTKIKPYKCSICLRGFNNEIGLQNHLWSHLPRGKKILANSDNVHTQRREASVYSSRGVLHTNPGTLRFVCPICGKKISTKGNLKVHLETHRPKGKYGCDICGRVFKTQPNLFRHKDYHGGVQFPCNVCGRVYPTNSTLRAHSITHSDLRPHACPLCDKTFKRNQDLKFHINQHTGARPYQCPYCPKAFASSGNCFSHRKRMHPQEVERDRERANQIMR